jgi:uncharacterized protein YdeI (YjbR/CyaY-like superfamily)
MKKATASTFLHRTPADITSLLQHAPQVKARWDTLTPLARNEWICYVTIVKKADTRQAHLTRLQSDLLAGKRRPCCWPGCPHRRPNTAKWFTAKR